MSQSAVVTGANSGIGLETCKQLLESGYSVFALDLSSSGLTELQVQHAGRLRFLSCDIRQADQVKETFEEIGRQTPGLDALVCSAGVLRTSPLMSMSIEDFDLLYAVNTRGAWLCARAAYPLLRNAATPAQPARIVMLASIAALRPKLGGGAYAASKAALSRLVRVMAVELGHEHIRVNAIAPATVDTPMIRQVATAADSSGYKASGTSPVGRVSVPDDIVAVVRFLLSSASNYVNGAMIPVDGGTSAAFVPV